MTLEQATEHLLANEPAFALKMVEIRGELLPAFANTPQTLREHFQHGASARKHDDYIVYAGTRLTYDDYVDQANRISHLLTNRFGVQKGDKVAIAMRNLPEFCTLFAGIVNIGAVAVLINGWWTSEELEYGFTDSGVKLAFADGRRAERIQPFAERRGINLVQVHDAGETLSALLAETPASDWPAVDIQPQDDYGILYSSGSTGHPKGVVLTHQGAISSIYSWVFAAAALTLMYPDAPDPRPSSYLCGTPLFHVTASHAVFLLSVAAGAKLVLMGKWDGEDALRLINREEVTRFIGVPTMSADIREASLRTGIGAPTLEMLASGGAKRPGSQVAEQAAAFPGANVATGWGLTETNAMGIGMMGEEYLDRPEMCGRLYPPLQQIAIMDDDARPLPVGEVGEIAIKASTLMRGYLNKPEATAEAIRNGWFLTGDLGRIDDEGYVQIVDRKKNIIIRGGENISCLEVEGALHRHPAVAEAVAFSAPDDRMGEVVAAAIWFRESVAPADLIASLDTRLATFKHPVRLWSLDAPLPRGATDKIDRRAIQEACLSGRLGEEKLL